MKKLFLALAICGFFGATGQSSITVNGSATRYVDSDEMILRTGIYEEGKDVDELYRSVQDRMRQILEEFGKDTAFCEIQTELIRIVPNRRYIKNGDKEERTYIIQQDISFRLREMNRYDEVVLELMKLGVNQLNDVQFVSSKANNLKEEVRTQSLIAARDKAEKMAETLGLELGPALKIEETGAPYIGYNSNTITYDALRAGGSGPSIAPAKASVSAKVKVTFATKPMVKP